MIFIEHKNNQNMYIEILFQFIVEEKKSWKLSEESFELISEINIALLNEIENSKQIENFDNFKKLKKISENIFKTTTDHSDFFLINYFEEHHLFTNLEFWKNFYQFKREQFCNKENLIVDFSEIGLKKPFIIEIIKKNDGLDSETNVNSLIF